MTASHQNTSANTSHCPALASRGLRGRISLVRSLGQTAGGVFQGIAGLFL